MTQSPKRLAVLVGALIILALALAAVAPAMAQDDNVGQGGQTGTPVELQPDDTLGSLVNENNLADENLRRFFSQNWDLVLEEGQTVIYPADYDVLFDADVQDFVDEDAEGRQTYLTQVGDTLGRVLSFTGFVRMEEGAGLTGMGADPTPTLAAGTVGNDVVVTPTEAAADTTGTTGDAGMTGQQGADLTDSQLEAFVEANSDLIFVEGQTVLFPTGVAVTGAEMTGQATPTLAVGETTDQDMQATPTGEEMTAEGVTAGTVTYTVESGDTLTGLADQFGITVEQLVEMNPDLLQSGMTLNVPAQSGQIPQTGAEAGQVDATPTLVVDDVAQATPTVVIEEELQVTPTPDAAEVIQETPTVAVEETMTPTPTVVVEEVVEPTPTEVVEATPTEVVEATPTEVVEPTPTEVVEATPTPDVADTTEATPTATPADTTAEAQVTPTPAATAVIPETGQQGQTQAQNLVTVCTGDGPEASAGFGKYRYRGESLQFLADQTNSTVGDIIALNGPDAFISGNIITLPGAEAPGFWNNRLLRDCTTIDLNARQQQGQVPQTGGDAGQTQATPTPAADGTTGQVPQTGQQDVAQNPNLVTVCTGDAPEASAGFGNYRYRGESLQFLADQTNSSVGDIIALNGPGAFISGNIITLPGAEAPGFWNNQLLRDCTTVDMTARQQADGE